MLHYTQSDVFDQLNKGNTFQKRLVDAVKHVDASVVMNHRLTENIAMMKKAFRETIAVKAVDAINKEQVILIAPPLEHRFPEFFPYARVVRSGKECVIVDISRFVSITKNADGDPIGYSADVQKLYNSVIPAYVILTTFSKADILPTEASNYLALMWARMFNKILMSIGVLANNKDRYEAFMYFAIRFFLSYYLHSPDAVIDNISNAYLIGGKTEMIVFMEEKMSQKGHQINSSFRNFCLTLFDNEVSNIKGMKSRFGDIDQVMFTQRFMNTYGKNAIMGLCAPDYFFYILFSAFRGGNYVNDRAFEDIVLFNKRDMPKLLESLYKEV